MTEIPIWLLVILFATTFVSAILSLLVLIIFALLGVEPSLELIKEKLKIKTSRKLIHIYKKGKLVVNIPYNRKNLNIAFRQLANEKSYKIKVEKEVKESATKD